MAESIQNLHGPSNASPVRPAHPTQHGPRGTDRAGKPEAESQTSPLNVEDKVELQLEPDAVRQLRPNTHLKFLVSDDSNRVIVQIIQSDTNEVLREVPPKSLSEALAALNGGFSNKIR